MNHCRGSTKTLRQRGRAISCRHGARLPRCRRGDPAADAAAAIRLSGRLALAAQSGAGAGTAARAGAAGSAAPDAGAAAPALPAAPGIEPPVSTRQTRPASEALPHCLNVRRRFPIPVVVSPVQKHPWERTHEDRRYHPVARFINSCAVVRRDTGIRDKNERQVLPDFRRRPFRTVTAGHGPACDPTHLQRLCGDLHSRYRRQDRRRPGVHGRKGTVPADRRSRRAL